MWMESVRGGKRIMLLMGNDDEIGLSSVVKDMKDVEAVKMLYCPSMLGFNRFDSTALEKATACEGLFANRLIDLTAHDQTFDVLVIESTANKSTASILLKLFLAWKKTFLIAF